MQLTGQPLWALAPAKREYGKAPTCDSLTVLAEPSLVEMQFLSCLDG